MNDNDPRVARDSSRATDRGADTRAGKTAPAARAARRAFTLTELLIVIGIIALLAAVLFPVFALVRTKARQSTCSSNLKQLGGAFAMYAQDYDDTLPAPGGYGGSFWDEIDSDGRSATLDAYLKNRSTTAAQVWVCPNLASGTLDPPSKGDAWYFLNFPRSYGMNTFLRAPAKTIEHKLGPAPTDVTDPDAFNPAAEPRPDADLSFLPNGITRSGIPAPAETVLLFEGIPVRAQAGSKNSAFNGYVHRHGDWRSVGGYWKDPADCTALVSKNGKFRGQTCQDPGLRPWHGGGLNNYLYCDGHVAAHRPVVEGWRPTRTDPGDFLVTHCRTAQAPCP